MPSFVEHIEPPTISYSYTKSICNVIFNHNAVIKDIDFSMGTSNTTCSCGSSRFPYAPAEHVITGNFDIVTNNINWQLNRNLCLEAVRKYKTIWVRRENIDIHILDEWEHTVGNHIEEKIKILIKKYIHKRKKQISRNCRHQSRECFEKLHDEYVLVPMDKASNNVVVICKNITLKL